MNIEESKIAEDSEGRKTLDLGGSYCRNDPGWNYNPGRIEKQLEQVVNKKTAGYAPELATQVKADTEHYQEK